MKATSLLASAPPRCWHSCAIIAIALSLTCQLSPAIASTCTSFAPGVGLAIVEESAILEASGLSVSIQNPKVLWTHNDGSKKKVFAIDFRGRLLARYDYGFNPGDVEDMEIGPGPVVGTSYLYFGDIGGNADVSGLRSSVKIYRIAEPLIDSNAWTAPTSANFSGLQTFTLTYPDGSYDAETLLLDPTNADLYVLTKQNTTSRLYKTNLNAAASGSTLALSFVRLIAFDQPSGGDILFDGSQIILRNETHAQIWNRTAGQTISAAFSNASPTIPVIGTPTEPNGEAVAFLRDGSGYATLSEELNQPLYYFQSQCPIKPVVLAAVENKSVFIGDTAQFSAIVSGFPAPTFVWKLNGTVLTGQTNSFLNLAGVTLGQAGTVEFTATNTSGSVSGSATLTVLDKPDLRITEVMSQAAYANGADWWELTNFESTPVNIGGWRFNDSSGDFTDSFTIPSGIIIKPRESIIFVEGMTAVQFRNWWGAANVPTTVQVVNYSGSGLAFAAGGDGVRLWNNTTTNLGEVAAGVSFGTATNGVSFNYAPETATFGGLSVLGVNGVFTSLVGGDRGSPGVYLAPLKIPDLVVTKVGNNFRIDFNIMVGRRYTLMASDDLTAGSWASTGDSILATSNTTAFFQEPLDDPRKFYRIVVE